MPNGEAGSTGPADPDPTIEAVRAIVRASRMLERASGELSLAHYRVLAAISVGEERASRVAERLAVGKPTVSAAVDVLVQRGLVARHIEVADNRVTVLRVTSEGWDVLARVEAGMVERLTRLAELTGDADGLVGCLAWLGRAPRRIAGRPGSGPVGVGAVTERAAGGWIRRLSGLMMHHRRDLWLGVAAAVLGSICQTIVPLIERQIVDGVIIEHSSPLWRWLVLLVVLSAADFGFAYMRRYRGGRVALAVQYDLRNAMHDHLQTMDLDNLDRMPTGQLVARANSDSALVQGLLSFFPIMSGNILMLVLSVSSCSTCRRCSRSSAWSSPRVCSPFLTGCAGGSSPPRGMASSGRATSSRSWTRTSMACAS